MRNPILLAAALWLLYGPLARTNADDDLPIRPAPRKSNPTPTQLLAALQEPIDVAEIAEPLNFTDSMKRLDRILARQKKSLPFLINAAALSEEAPDAPNLNDNSIKPPEQPARPTVRQVLRSYVSQCKGVDVDFFVSAGYIEITSGYRAQMPFRLAAPVTLNVRGRPLALVLDDLFEQSGVAINIDPRFQQRTLMPVTAISVDAMRLDKALYLLLNMADLRMVTVGNSVYVTSPQNAYKIYWERNTIDHFPFRVTGTQLATP